MSQNIRTFTDELDGKEFVIIDREDGSFTSMTKAHYEELETNKVEHLTEIVPANE
jgi:hypothetical protein